MLQIKNTLGGGKPEGLYVWKKCENNTDHTFIDYVVSDKETAYPDGGEKGGYWYERVSEGITPEMFGLSKMEVVEYIPASDEGLSTRGLSFTHSLGETPKLEILTSDINKSPSYNHLAEYIKFAIGNVTMFTFYSTNFNSNKDLYKISVTKDANTVTIAPYSSSYIPWFISGNTYKFIFMV